MTCCSPAAANEEEGRVVAARQARATPRAGGRAAAPTRARRAAPRADDRERDRRRVGAPRPRRRRRRPPRGQSSAPSAAANRARGSPPRDRDARARRSGARLEASAPRASGACRHSARCCADWTARRAARALKRSCDASEQLLAAIREQTPAAGASRDQPDAAKAPEVEPARTPSSHPRAAQRKRRTGVSVQEPQNSRCRAFLANEQGPRAVLRRSARLLVAAVLRATPRPAAVGVRRARRPTTCEGPEGARRASPSTSASRRALLGGRAIAMLRAADTAMPRASRAASCWRRGRRRTRRCCATGRSSSRPSAVTCVPRASSSSARTPRSRRPSGHALRREPRGGHPAAQGAARRACACARGRRRPGRVARRWVITEMRRDARGQELRKDATWDGGKTGLARRDIFTARTAPASGPRPELRSRTSRASSRDAGACDTCAAATTSRCDGVARSSDDGARAAPLTSRDGCQSLRARRRAGSHGPTTVEASMRPSRRPAARGVRRRRRGQHAWLFFSRKRPPCDALSRLLA